MGELRDRLGLTGLQRPEEDFALMVERELTEAGRRASESLRMRHTPLPAGMVPAARQARAATWWLKRQDRLGLLTDKQRCELVARLEQERHGTAEQAEQERYGARRKP